MINNSKHRTVIALVVVTFLWALLMNSHMREWLQIGTTKTISTEMERRKNATTSGSEVEKKNQPTQPATTTRQSAGTPQWTGKGQPENRKWLVTTTTNPRPNQQIMELANISGWTLVVVGNQTSKSPEVWRSDHSSSKIVYLGPEEQSKLISNLGQVKLDRKFRSNKIYGYLYAIQQGASHIYDVDSHLVVNKIGFQFDPTTSGMVYDNRSRTVVNPHVHFGQPSVRARGFPLEYDASPYNDQYKVFTFKTPAIQQGVSGDSVDVDTSRLMYNGWPSNPSSTPSAKGRVPSVTVPPGILAPFNSRNTLFAAEAFWALLIPNSVPAKMADIWRSYWSQPLLWITGNTLAFWPTNTSLPDFDPINDSPYDDMKDEIQFYQMAKDFVDFLVNWTCNDKSFFSCVQSLTTDLATNGFCDQSEIQVTQWWIDSLKAMHYEEPKIVSRRSATGSYDNFFDESESKEVFLYHSRSHSSALNPVNNARESNDALLSLHHVCRNYLNLSDSLAKPLAPSYTYPDTLLVIVFNFPFLRLIGYLDILYRDHFPNIVYCTNDNYTEVERKIRDGWSLPWTDDHLRVTVLSVKMSRGLRGYECATGAIQMNYKVDGYLILADDMLFNFWNFKHYPPMDLPLASQPIVHFHYRHNNQSVTKWGWWTTRYGMGPTNAAIDDLIQLASNTSDSRSALADVYFQNLRAQGFNDSTVWFGLADLYYIPAKLSQLFSLVVNVFAKHRPTMEIVIPTTLKGLIPHSTNVSFSGSSLWDSDRDDPIKFFNVSADFLHPVKLTSILQGSNLTSQYCQDYIEKVLNHW